VPFAEQSLHATTALGILCRAEESLHATSALGTLCRAEQSLHTTTAGTLARLCSSTASPPNKLFLNACSSHFCTMYGKMKSN